jgi:hypothetical protein
MKNPRNLVTTSVAMIALALASMTSVGQSSPLVSQKSEQSACSNIVALTGNVSLNCSDLTADQKKAIANIPTILKMALLNKDYLAVIIQKLDDLAKNASGCKSYEYITGGEISDSVHGIYNANPGKCFVMNGVIFDHNMYAITEIDPKNPPAVLPPPPAPPQ